jgi:hypothetical protein
LGKRRQRCFRGAGGAPLGDFGFRKSPRYWSGYGTIANLEPFYLALKRAARLNGAAAFCAFVSAAAQAIVMAA